MLDANYRFMKYLEKLLFLRYWTTQTRYEWEYRT